MSLKTVSGPHGTDNILLNRNAPRGDFSPCTVEVWRNTSDLNAPHETFHYDGYGLCSHTNRRGFTKSYGVWESSSGGVTAQGRLNRVTAPNGDASSVQYNADYSVQSVTGPSGLQTSFSYVPNTAEFNNAPLLQSVTTRPLAVPLRQPPESYQSQVERL